jgi:hypothetical protein
MRSNIALGVSIVSILGAMLALKLKADPVWVLLSLMLIWRLAADWADRNFLLLGKKIVAINDVAAKGRMHKSKATMVMSMGSFVFAIAAIVLLFKR